MPAVMTLALSEFPVTTCFEASFAFERSPFIDGRSFRTSGTHENGIRRVLTSRRALVWDDESEFIANRERQETKRSDLRSGVRKRKVSPWGIAVIRWLKSRWRRVIGIHLVN